jgi:hypothetical protein
LSKRWNWSRTKVRCFLSLLEKSSQITSQTNNKTTIISICNYDKYQGKQPSKKQQTDIESTTDNHKQETTENDKQYIYNKFYDSEIEKSNGDENYLKTVIILFGENNLSVPLTSVLAMEVQLSYQQFTRIWYLKDKYGFNISEILEEMENWKKLKGNKTVFRTFITFLKTKNPGINLE